MRYSLGLTAASLSMLSTDSISYVKSDKYDADTVLQRKAGDCKGYSTLFVAMAQLAVSPDVAVCAAAPCPLTSVLFVVYAGH